MRGSGKTEASGAGSVPIRKRGIEDEQAVRDALSQNDAFEILETTRQGEWVSITARKR